MSINVAKWTLFFSFCAFRIIPFLLLTLSKSHAGIVSSFLHSLSTAAFASEIFIACDIGKICVANCNDSSNCVLCLRYDFHEFSVEMIPNAFPWTHEPPRCVNALFFFGILLNSSLFASVSKPGGVLLCSFFLQSIAASIGTSNFLLAFFDGFFIFIIFCIDEIHASQSSSIIELRFLVCPFLLFFLQSGFSHFGPHFKPQILRSGSCLNFCYSPLGPHFSLGRFFFQYCELRESSPRVCDKCQLESTFQ